MSWIKKHYESLVFLLFSCMFSAALILTFILYVPMQQIQNFTAGINTYLLNIQNICIYIVFVVIVFIVLKKCYLKMGSICIDSTSEPKMSFLKYSFLFNLLSWGLWFLVYYPGASMNDTINLLMQPYQNPMQPLIYQIIIWYSMSFFYKIFQDMTLSFGLMVAVQMIINAFILAYVTNWLSQKRVKQSIIWFVLFYYALLPSIANYSITLIKDTPFSIFILFFVTQLYDIVTQSKKCLSNKKFVFIFILTACSICAMRANGFLVIILTLLGIMLLKTNYKKLLSGILCLVLVFNTSVSFAENQRFDSDVKFREMICVPLTQIGAVLNSNSAQLDTNEIEILNQLLPVNIWKESYRPSFADLIKYNLQFNNDWLNNNKIKFLSVWYDILKDNFPIYVKSYLCHTYAYWSVAPSFSNIDYTQSFFTKINNNTLDDSIWGNFCTNNKLENKILLPESISNEFHTLFKSSFTLNLLLSPGIMFWLVIGFYTLLIAKKRYRICFAFLPIILVWLTLMLAAPASFIYRYSFYLVLTFPLVIVLSLKELGKTSEDLNVL